MQHVIDKPACSNLQRAAPSSGELVRRAELILLLRRRRLEIFDPAMFNEPAWDGLLALYVDEAAGLTVTIPRLADLIGTRVEACLRWIDYLQDKGLVSRTGSRKVAASVALTEKGRSDLELYLSGIAGDSSE